MITNYQKIFSEIIANLKSKPRLLLHSCCAPCSSSVLERLVDYFDVSIYYFNPNTAPKAEYDRRLSELKAFLRASKQAQSVKLIEGNYDHNLFLQTIKGLEEEKEGGKRCYSCYKLRLAETMRYGICGGFDFFTTTLSVSPYKNAEWVNHLGLEMAEGKSINFLPSDFKKANGYLRSLELSREYSLYRQDYCGCEFSFRE